LIKGAGFSRTEGGGRGRVPPAKRAFSKAILLAFQGKKILVGSGWGAIKNPAGSWAPMGPLSTGTLDQARKRTHSGGPEKKLSAARCSAGRDGSLFNHFIEDPAGRWGPSISNPGCPRREMREGVSCRPGLSGHFAGRGARRNHPRTKNPGRNPGPLDHLPGWASGGTSGGGRLDHLPSHL